MSQDHDRSANPLIFISIFRIGTNFDKYTPFYDSPVVAGSHITIAPLKPAKRRKDMLQPYFSKAAIQRLEPTIKSKITRMIELMSKAAITNQHIDLTYAYRCLTIDVITDYCFQKSFNSLEAKDFKDPLAHTFVVLSKNARFEKYLQGVSKIAHWLVLNLPPSFIKWVSPELGSIRELRDVSLAQWTNSQYEITDIRRSTARDRSDTAPSEPERSIRFNSRVNHIQQDDKS